MALIQSEISAEAVVEAMNEDGQFLLEMWETLAEHLNMGLLLDNSCDVLGAADSLRAEAISFQFEQFSNSILQAQRIQGKSDGQND